MKFCSECGSRLPENPKFCPECGMKLVDSVPSALEENQEEDRKNETQLTDLNDKQTENEISVPQSRPHLVPPPAQASKDVQVQPPPVRPFTPPKPLNVSVDKKISAPPTRKDFVPPKPRTTGAESFVPPKPRPTGEATFVPPKPRSVAGQLPTGMPPRKKPSALSSAPIPMSNKPPVKKQKETDIRNDPWYDDVKPDDEKNPYVKKPFEKEKLYQVVGIAVGAVLIIVILLMLI